MAPRIKGSEEKTLRSLMESTRQAQKQQEAFPIQAERLIRATIETKPQKKLSEPPKHVRITKINITSEKGGGLKANEHAQTTEIRVLTTSKILRIDKFKTSDKRLEVGRAWEEWIEDF